MDAVGRRKMLRLLDAQNALLAESKLMSFTAGFKLAWGMAQELEANRLYSFEREEEEHICRPAEQVDACSRSMWNIQKQSRFVIPSPANG